MKILFQFGVFIILYQVVCGDPCNEYQTINDWQRSVANTHGLACDSSLEAGWYRVTSGAGELLPTECVRYGDRCGTAFPVWLNGSYPTGDETVNVTACTSDSDGNCCVKSYDIQIKKCSGFDVHYLLPVTGCPEAYCFGTELPCPESQTSPTGFTPGCQFDPCLRVNHIELDDWKRSVKNNASSNICDALIESGWYKPISKAGNLMPTECPVGGFTCGTIYPIWMNGTYPAVNQTTTVTACTSSHLDGCCYKSYEMEVKNCDGTFVYNLQKSVGCSQGHCFGSEIPCPVGYTSPTGFTPGCEFDPCLQINHIELDDWKRSLKNKATTNICDAFIEPGWYKPVSKAGNIMPTECPVDGFTCGTVYPIWMNGSYPSEGQTTTVKACVSSHLQDCCFESYDIQIKNCAGMFVYNLETTPGCPKGYCFGTEIPCPPGTTSDNGFTPCEFDPCQNYKTLNGQEKRSSGYFLESGEPINDELLMEAWYRFDSYVGNDLVREGQPINRCGTIYPAWLNGELPLPSDKTVNRTCCISKEDGMCQSTTDIQIRNCGDFRVYFLQALQNGPSAYCVGTLPVRKHTTEKPADVPHPRKPTDLVIGIIILTLVTVCIVTVLGILFLKKVWKKKHPSCVSISSFPNSKPPLDGRLIRESSISLEFDNVDTQKHPI